MGSHKLKLLAISDTHLGEETSLLSFPRGLQQLWQTLAKDTHFWRPPQSDPERAAHGSLRPDIATRGPNEPGLRAL
jgi:hypothetical protein